MMRTFQKGRGNVPRSGENRGLFEAGLFLGVQRARNNQGGEG